MTHSSRGFSLVEVVVALFVITLATLLLGGLGKQVISFSKKTRQTAAVLELRAKTVSIIKDSEKFLTEMRSFPISGATADFNACLQARGAITPFACPAVDSGFITPGNVKYDKELERLAAGNYQVIDTPIVDAMGIKIAGSRAAPEYMTNDGVACTETQKETKCPLRSIGYFLRTNSANDQPPGSVKFVVKVENNPIYRGARDVTPMKAQYMTVDLGSQWNASATTCTSPSIQVGVHPDGSVMCLLPINCPSSPPSLLTGVTGTGAPLCKEIPPCTDATKRVVLNAAGELQCVDAGNPPPCAFGEVHLGYAGGTGQPICSVPKNCQTNEILMGSECKPIEDCTDTKTITFSQGSFGCVARTSEGVNCDENEVVVGIDSSGNPKCAPAPTREVAAETTFPNCNPGEYITTYQGKLICYNPLSALPKCGPGEYITTHNGTLICYKPFPTCHPPDYLVADQGGGFKCAPRKTRVQSFYFPDVNVQTNRDLGCFTFCALSATHDCANCGYSVWVSDACPNPDKRRWAVAHTKGAIGVQCFDIE